LRDEQIDVVDALVLIRVDDLILVGDGRGKIVRDPLLGIGLGTVISMLGVGRVVAAFNHLCKPAITRAAGLEKVVRK